MWEFCHDDFFVSVIAITPLRDPPHSLHSLSSPILVLPILAHIML
jgi:hypothetical protein